MNKFLIERYINKLTKQDIITYINNQNIKIPLKDIDTIHYYIKNKYKSFLNGQDKELLEEIKYKVSPSTYKELKKIYDMYKNKI